MKTLALQPAPQFVLYTSQGKYFLKSKTPGSQEREISMLEYYELLEIKNNSHQRLHKAT